LRKNGETVYIHPSVDWCKGIELDGCIVIEKNSNPPAPFFNKEGNDATDISLRNCIILPDTNFSYPHSFENCILGPGFKIDLKESEILGGVTNGDAILIGTGGSDRQYYRVRKNKGPVVRMQCRKDDPDFLRQLEYTRFFRKHSIPVPDLIDVDSENMSASFEDLGDLSLYSWLKCPRNQGEIEGIYGKVLDSLVLFHTTATRHVSECPLLQQRVFDYDHLRWETRYFLERFVVGIQHIETARLSAIKEEFHRLALTVDAFPKTIVHRDFQSQNIMIMNGGTPRIIDYQGARIGPPAYDVASILWDPYYRLEDEVREKLLEYYLQQINLPLSHTLLPCRLQRHMQALGAFGYLSMVKGKKYFLKHIPEALRLLKEESALTKDEYPELYRLVSAL